MSAPSASKKRVFTEAQRERRRENNRKYEERNAERRKTQKKAWYEANKRERLAQMRAYWLSLKHSPEGHAKQLLQRARRRATKLGMSATIDEQWVLTRLAECGFRCEVTGIPFQFDDQQRNPWQPSLDRLDPTRGYDPDNCRVTILMYNYARNVATDADVERFARDFAAKLL